METEIISIATVLFFAFLGGIILQRFNLPSLIGYIIAGIVIGPSVLGLSADFDSIRTLADVAVILLMFMLGIELDVHKFRIYAGKSFFVAVLQILAGITVMYFVGSWLNWTISTIILFGFITSISSTAVAVGTLRHIGLLETEKGQLAVGILIAEDILLAPMLLIVGFGGNAFEYENIFKMLFSLSIIALSLLAVFEIYKHKWILEWIENTLRRGATQAAISGLMLCFGAAALSGLAGLSVAYGAFLIGLFIQNVGAVGTIYKNAIEPIHDLLIMIFFLSIGLLIDISYIISNPFSILIVLLAVVTLKTLGNCVLIRITGASAKTSIGLGAALGHIGEFGFVLLSAGLTNGFVEKEEYQLGLAVIAISLIISPLWFGFVRRMRAEFISTIIKNNNK